MIPAGEPCDAISASDNPDDPTISRVGVGPHPQPWPEDPRLDPELLANGDTRNVQDPYRYWSLEAIRDQLACQRTAWRPARLQVAIQNWTHDFNIGSIVRTANAFNVEAVNIIGRKRWNRRGAMVTDRYLEVIHQPDEKALVEHCREQGLAVVGVDNMDGSVPLESVRLPQQCCLVFGSEGPGLTKAMLAACDCLVAITQFGSTRSLNAGAAAAITIHHWTNQHIINPIEGGVR